jgi:uncharacterized protein involved in type VI secretion and phage assembly
MMSDRPDGGLAPYYGLYPAKVTDSTPDDLGRIEVELPWLGQNPADEAGQQGDAGEPVRIRATLLSSWAAADQGLLTLPPNDSQVIVGFEAGNLARAYVVGACWNGVAQMPHQGSASSGSSTEATEDRRVLRTKTGHYIEFDESSGSNKLTLATAGGHKITLDDTSSEISITHSSGHAIKLEASGNISITANAGVSITASSGLTVTAPTAQFSGIVQCTALIASTAVSSPVYTPGIGGLL